MTPLHPRIAQALGWPLSDTLTMSLLTLRELVRPVDRDLAADITRHLADDAHVAPPVVRRTPRQPFVVGDQVRCRGAFLRSTGQHTGNDAHRIWTVLSIDGDFVTVDERKDPGYRRFHRHNLILAGAADHS